MPGQVIASIDLQFVLVCNLNIDLLAQLHIFYEMLLSKSYCKIVIELLVS